MKKEEGTRKGRLIVLCGTDGSGKATQAKILVENLKKAGIATRATDFPQYGKPSAWMVEQYLNGTFGSAKEVGPYRASLFFAIDRYQASFQMKEWLTQGNTIVSNRYVSANMGHQGGQIANPEERKKYIDWVQHVEYEIFGIPKPDLTLFLHIPAETAQRLVDKKGEREYVGGEKRDIHEADLDHLKHAESCYTEVCSKNPYWKQVACTEDNQLLSIEEISKKIWAVVTEAFAL